MRVTPTTYLHILLLVCTFGGGIISSLYSRVALAQEDVEVNLDVLNGYSNTSPSDPSIKLKLKPQKDQPSETPPAVPVEPVTIVEENAPSATASIPEPDQSAQPPADAAPIQSVVTPKQKPDRHVSIIVAPPAKSGEKMVSLYDVAREQMNKQLGPNVKSALLVPHPKIKPAPPTGKHPAVEKINDQMSVKVSAKTYTNQVEEKVKSAAPEKIIEKDTSSEIDTNSVDEETQPPDEIKSILDESGEQESTPTQSETVPTEQPIDLTKTATQAEAAPLAAPEKTKDDSTSQATPEKEVIPLYKALSSILLKPGQTDLNDQDFAQIDESLFVKLHDRPTSRLILYSYASSTNEGQNSDRRIALLRALSMRDFLLSIHVEPSQISLKAVGEEQDGANKDRIDFVIEP